MKTEGEIINKIQQSGKLVTIDLQDFYDATPRKELDLKDFLFKGMILKEKEFREALDDYDWSQFEGAYVSIFCSTDAIISKWAYMLVGQYLAPHAKEIFEGRKQDILKLIYRRKLELVEWEKYQDKFAILKGCSDDDRPVPESAYLYATQKLLPHVKKLMYGEACSNVPIYRN